MTDTHHETLANHVAASPACDPVPAAIWVLVPCAGSGARSGAAQPKQYQRLAGRALVLHTLAAFEQVARVRQVLVLLAPGDRHYATLDTSGLRHCAGEYCGAASRAGTVANGLTALRSRGAREDDWVLVHDAARCLVTPELIDRLIDACLEDAVGGLLAVPVADTIKLAQGERVASTVDRSRYWLAQTPQMFRVGALLRALAQVGDAVTDEASAIESLGLAPRLVPGDPGNFKVTVAHDFALAQAILLSRAGTAVFSGEAHDPESSILRPATAFRIGEGWDVHRLVEGRPLVIGGVTIPFERGLLGHSDADVLLHAITDAVLGAAALGDIGRHFPDTDPRFKGADSSVLLAEASARVRATGWQIGNVDSTVIAQAPRLMPWIPAMCAAIAKAMGLDLEQVNVKAKTAEGLGPVGQGEAMQARAIVLLVRC